MATPKLSTLIRLLDDETPAVRESVARALGAYRGDLSEQLVDTGVDLSANERALLSSLLRAGRRERLMKEWEVPTGGWTDLGDDWERFEGLLRLVSDFLHDGLTLRLPLADGLDLVAEEYELAGGELCPLALARWLFVDGRFVGNEEEFHAPENSDLAWVLAEGRSNPIGLALVYILTGWRLGLEIEGCPFPARFLCRIRIDGRLRIVDCYDGGRTHDLIALLSKDDMSGSARRALKAPAPPGAMLVRLLRNLRNALVAESRDEDVGLVMKLLASLRAEP